MYHHTRSTRNINRIRAVAEAQAAYSAAAQISTTEIAGEAKNPNQAQADKIQISQPQTQTETDQITKVQKSGALNSKLTSYHQNEVGWSEENLPNLLFQLEQGQRWGLEPSVPFSFKNDGVNPSGLKVNEYDFLPAQISILPEPFRLEMYLGRLHSRCICRDLHQRMNPGPDESVMNANAVNMSRMRLRNHLNTPCWTKRRETPSQVECLLIEQVSWASIQLNTVLPVGATGLLKPTCIIVDHSMAPFEYYDTPRDTAQLPHVIIPFTTFIGEKAVHVPGPRLESVLNTVAELQALAYDQGYPHWIFLKNRDKPKAWSYKAQNQHHPNSGPNDISVPAPQALPRIGLLWIEFCIQKAVENKEMILPLDKLTGATRDWVEAVIAWAEDEIKGVPEVEIAGSDLASAKAEDDHECINGAVGWAGDAMQEASKNAIIKTPLPELDLAVATANDIRKWLEIADEQPLYAKPELVTAAAEYVVKPVFREGRDLNGHNQGGETVYQVEYSNAQPRLLSAGFGVPTAHANAREVATERNDEVRTEVQNTEAGNQLTFDEFKASHTCPLSTELDLKPAPEMALDKVEGWNAGAESQIEPMELDDLGCDGSAVLDPHLHETFRSVLEDELNPPPAVSRQVASVADKNRELDTYEWVPNQIEPNQASHQDEGTETRPYVPSEALMDELYYDDPNLFPDLPQIPDLSFFDDYA